MTFHLARDQLSKNSHPLREYVEHIQMHRQLQRSELQFIIYQIGYYLC
jgi:hypothetical protein